MRRRLTSLLVFYAFTPGLGAALLLAATASRAQGLVPMAGASAIQGGLQGTATPAYTGELDRARTTLNGASTPPAGPGGNGGTASPAAAAAQSPGSSAASSGANLAGQAPSGASVNGRPIPLCSHGGLCQGALMRAMGRP